MKIDVKLPDGSVRSYEQGVTAMDVARDISEGLARNVLAAKVNGQVWDAGRVLPGDCDLQLLTWNDGDFVEGYGQTVKSGHYLPARGAKLPVAQAV